MRARTSARPARSCSAASAPPTRCSRRSSTASTSTTFPFRARTRAYMDAVMALPAWKAWIADAEAEDMAHRKIRRRLSRADAGALRRAAQGAAFAPALARRAKDHRRRPRARPLDGFLPQRDDGELAGVFRRARGGVRRRQSALSLSSTRSATTPIANARPGSLSDLFFFSVETTSTVGYGDMHPQTMYGHIVATARTSSAW